MKFPFNTKKYFELFWLSNKSDKLQSEWCESSERRVQGSKVAPIFQTVLHCPLQKN